MRCEGVDWFQVGRVADRCEHWNEMLGICLASCGTV